MSDLFRSIRDFTVELLGIGTPSRKQNGTITIKESEFHGNARHFIRKSLQDRQVVVRDESGSVMMILGQSGYELFPPDEDDIEHEVDLSVAPDDDPRPYDSWLR